MVGSGGQVITGGTSAGGITAAGGQTAAGSGAGGRGAVNGGTTALGGISSTGGFKATGGSNFGGSGGVSGSASGGTGGAGGATTAGAGAGGGMGSDALTLYSAACASCHGDRGQGVPMMGPELQHPVRDFSTWVVRNGRQGNPAFPNSVMAAFPESALPNATLESIYTWLSTPALPKPTTGEALYKDYCANCHGATGVGGTAGHDAKGEPLSKALTMVRGGHSLTQFSSRTGYMPKWTTSELSDAEVTLIVNYLDSL